MLEAYWIPFRPIRFGAADLFAFFPRSIPAVPAIPANAQQEMFGPKPGLPADASGNAAEIRHRIVHQLPATQAIKMGVLARPSGPLVEEPSLVHGDALDHAAVNQQVERAVDGSPGDAGYAAYAAMKSEEELLGREVAAHRLDAIEDPLALAGAAGGGGPPPFTDT
jgi:hypothetical protein